MAEIKIKDLGTCNISGTDLFDDLENFMIEVTDETTQIFGGIVAAVDCGHTNLCQHTFLNG
jgi:hypothetical protein